MQVLALCAFPKQAAATRFRLEQFVGPLRKRGIELTISPFLDGGQFRDLYKSGGLAKKAFGLVPPVLRRSAEIFSSGKYDLLYVQREAAIFGPGVFEWLFTKIGRVPMVLDLDDATYVPYISPTYGRFASFFKFFGKTDNLIRRSSLVICGNRFIADYVESRGTPAVVIPTVVDTAEFFPIDKHNDPPVIGWVGTHSTYPFLESLFPVLARLAQKHRFRLKVVGAGVENVKLSGVEVENLEWSLEREIPDFQSLDIGLYPITVSESANEQWILGKSGFKAIQYMAVGVPFVMSPVGVCAELGEPGKTHLNAESPEDWYNSLNMLLSDEKFRAVMGTVGREHSLREYRVETQAELLAGEFRKVAERD